MFASVALARPQSEDDLLNRLGPVAEKALYQYEYQIRDEESQNYLNQKEARDGNDVVGTYSYVDAHGSLVTVEYTAGVNGYQETRTVEPGFITVSEGRDGFTAPTPKPTPRPAP